MARIRTIKPEFFRHEELQELEIEMPGQYPMMVFSALWGHCDKNGVFEWKPRQLQLDIIPFVWEATGKHLGSTLEALVKRNFIETYTDGRKVYGFIPTFKKHQRINGKEAQSPAQFPEVEQMQIFAISEATEKQPRSNREATEITGREGKGIGREEEVKTQGAKKPKSPQLAVALIELPSFVLRDSWLGFIEMRQKIKKPPTERAAQMLVKKLINFHNRGFDANEILDQSTVNSWQDLYEPKEQSRNNQRQEPKTFEQIKMERTKQAMRDFVEGNYDGTGQEALCVVNG